MAKKKMSAKDFGTLLGKKTKKDWKGARTVEDTFGDLDVPDGTYVVKVSGCQFGKTKKGAPYVSINGTIVGPEEYKGQRPGAFFEIAERGKRTMKMALEMFFVALQRLGIETKDMVPTDIGKAIKELNEEKPLAVFSVENDKKYGAQVSVLRLAQDDETDEDDDIEVEDSDENEETEDGDEYEEEEVEEEEEDEDSEEESEEEEELEEEEEEESYSKGDTVLYTVRKGKPRSKCKVKTVNNKKKTVTLQRIRDKKTFKAVPFDKIDHAEEE